MLAKRWIKSITWISTLANQINLCFPAQQLRHPLFLQVWVSRKSEDSSKSYLQYRSECPGSLKIQARVIFMKQEAFPVSSLKNVVLEVHWYFWTMNHLDLFNEFTCSKLCTWKDMSLFSLLRIMLFHALGFEPNKKFDGSCMSAGKDV
jgi:hypothetical protein